MDGADENIEATTKPTSFRETGNRGALKDIGNLVERTSAEIGCASDQKPAVVSHRPTARKHAELLARKAQPCDQVASGKHEPCSSDSSSAITFDDDKSVNKLPLPPIVEDKEELENSELRKVETVDNVKETVPNIDSLDTDNPLAVVDYVEDIYRFYREAEYDINGMMRAVLVDWLIEVHYKFELMDETLFLTVNTIDRFLERQAVVRRKLQLVGVTAMLLACKYEEVSVPVVDDLILITDRAYTRKELLEMEKLMLKTLQFNMSVPTPYVFLRRFLKAAQSDRQLELLSFFLTELCLLHCRMLDFRPSLLAAAAVYTAQCSLRGYSHWTRTSEMHTGYSEKQFFVCSRLMVYFHMHSGTGKLTAVHGKYSSARFGCAAATHQPALFLLNPELSRTGSDE